MMMSNPEEKKMPVKKKPADAVADLERRLAELSNDMPVSVPPPAVSTIEQAPPAFATNSLTTAESTTTTAAASQAKGKNALLARIMAAQERAKQAQGGHAAPTVQPQTTQPITMPSAPAPSEADVFSMDLPPPAFEDSMLPPPPPPPAFDAAILPPPVTHQQEPPSFHPWDPHAPTSYTAPSAPAFEDLIGTETVSPPPLMDLMPPPMPPPAFGADQQSSTGLDDEALQAILGIEGLSDAEKQELINEQMRIMKQIEDSKKSAQVSAADAFESRSFSAAVKAVSNTSNGNRMQLYGQERTREAIADGTACTVQCTACESWMQITNTAQLMFCPVCQTVSPVQGSGLTPEEAEQMAADAKLAEQLQKEEYESADREERRQRVDRQQKGSSSTASPEPKSQSWMEWLGFGTPAPAPTQQDTSQEISFSRSTDSADNQESTGLISRGRVAKQQPLFACVTDSISSAANYALTGSTLAEDEEGNVHGVDASSLLAVTQVGRERTNDSSDQMYEKF